MTSLILAVSKRSHVYKNGLNWRLVLCLNIIYPKIVQNTYIKLKILDSKIFGYFGSVLTSFLPLVDLKMVTYQCKGSQMKDFDVYHQFCFQNCISKQQTEPPDVWDWIYCNREKEDNIFKTRLQKKPSIENFDFRLILILRQAINFGI